MKWIMRFSHRLETDAAFQFRFNAFFAGAWFVAMLLLPFVPVLWGTIPALIIEEVSLWANFATHFAGMSSGIAAMASKGETTSHPWMQKGPAASAVPFPTRVDQA